MNDQLAEDQEHRDIGAVAQALDALSLAHRARLDRTSVLRICLALGIYALILVGLAILVPRWSTASGESVPIFVLWIALAAFVFETLDSASGMGFGATLGALLFVFGYEPLAVVPALLISETATGLGAGLFHTEFENVQLGFADESSAKATRVLALIVGVGVVAIVISVVLAYFAISIPNTIVKIYVGVVILLCAATTLVMKYGGSMGSYRPKRMVAFAILAGFNKGVTGSGFGPVITLGEILSGIYEKSATAIASLSEGLVSLAGVLAFFGITAAGTDVNLMLLPSIFAGGFLAAIFAPYTVRVLPNRILQYVVPGYGILLAFLVFIEFI